MIKIKIIPILLLGSALSYSYADTIETKKSPLKKSTWTGIYAGINASVIQTEVTNSHLNAMGFTNAAFGVDAGYNYEFDSSLILGAGIQWNFSPFKNSAFNDAGDGFYEQNQTNNFGSILANFGMAVNEHFAILGHAGIGYLKATSTGQTYGSTPKFSDHSATFVMPVVGASMIYKADNGIYGKFGMTYYIPTSQTYYSTVGLANATLRKSVFQTDLGIGYYF